MTVSTLATKRTSRRRFLAGAGACTGGFVAAHALGPQLVFASPSDPSRGDALVVVFLRGAADGLSLTPPIGAAFDSYRAIRPTIHLTPSMVRPLDDSNPNAVFPQGLSGVVGLHPTLNGLFDTVWNAGQMAVIPASGMPDFESRSRSHFEMQRFTEFGSANFGVRTGWLTRLINGQPPTGPVAGVNKSSGASDSYRGSLNSFTVPDLRNFGVQGFRDRTRARQALRTMHEGSGFINQVGRATLDAEAAIDAVDAEAGPAYPNNGFARDLKQVANLLRADIGLVTAIVNSNGWDHHDEQGVPSDPDGRFNRRSRELGDALTAFVTDLGPALDETLVCVISEFGRTIDENGNGGTDHGRGGTTFLIGGGVQGGVYGRDYPDVIQDTNENRRALPVLTDYRQAIDEVLTSRVNVSGVFPTLPSQPPLGVSR